MLDPQANDDCGDRFHEVRWRTNVAVLRPELYLFIPPETGQYNESILSYAAQAGYRAIRLGQANSVHVEDVCASDTTGTCMPAFVEESVYGVSTSPFIDIGPPDSVIGGSPPSSTTWTRPTRRAGGTGT